MPSFLALVRCQSFEFSLRHYITKLVLPVLISILVGFYLLMQSGTLDKTSSLGLLVVLMIAVLTVQFFATHKKLNELMISESYLKSFKLAFLVRTIGLLAFVLLSYLQ